MPDPVSWILPLREAYKHRKEIGSVWDWLVKHLAREKKTVAFTGHAGVGKTVLFDYLSGKAFRRDYRLPGASQKQETSKIKDHGRSIRLATVPGQPLAPRFEAIDQLFAGPQAVDGIVHVVANGFVETRDPVSKKILVNDRGIDTLEKYRTHQREIELADLDDTCRLIRDAHRRYRRPKWLLVAVAKFDLLYVDQERVREYYSPENAASPFAQRLNGLRRQVGEDYFRWEAAPVCCRPEPFMWNGETVAPALGDEERDHLLAAFAAKLKDIC